MKKIFTVIIEVIILNLMILGIIYLSTVIKDYQNRMKIYEKENCAVYGYKSDCVTPIK